MKRAESRAPLSLALSPEYPRPQMVREKWMSLDGDWRFAFDDSDEGEREKWFDRTENEKGEIPGIQGGGRSIRVPYTYETKMSGIGEEEIHSVVWYWKTAVIPDGGDAERYLLHFDGCDYRTKVWINGACIGSHTGGYTRFTFELGKLKAGDVLEICVRVQDDLSEEQARGKQRWLSHNYGCWYVQTTGIWKSVWMEPVGAVCGSYIRRIRLTPDIHRKELALEGEIAGDAPGETTVRCTVTYQGMVVSRMTAPVQSGSVSVTLPVYDTRAGEWGTALWSPDSPALYDLEMVLLCGECENDRITSYFGMREIRTDGAYVLLNGQPLYQKLVLYQGYHPERGLTTYRDEDILSDLDKIREMGFNGLRIHQKTECERFLYWCDVKGLLVWTEGPSFYRFTDNAAAAFAQEWLQIVREHYSHPAVAAWTPLNESWGVSDIKTDERQQHFSRMIWHLTKALDPMRPVIGNDGWEHTESDIITLHDYEEDGEQMKRKYLDKMDEILAGSFFHNNYRSAFAQGFSYLGQPVMISEYGGAAFAQKGENDWGYGKSVGSEEEFLARFRELTIGIKSIPEVCGYCYTQFTDVQQEKNGLLTEDRRYKVSPEKIKEIIDAPAGMFVNKKGY